MRRRTVAALVVAVVLTTSAASFAASTLTTLNTGDSLHVDCAGIELVVTTTPTSADLACTGYIVPLSIDATGATDVTADLNAFLASVPNGSAVRFPAGGQYRIEGTLKLHNRTSLTIDGQDSTLFATTNGYGDCPGSAAYRCRSQWEVKDSTDITLRNINVRGSNPAAGFAGVYEPALEAQHGFTIQGSTNVLLDHVSSREVWGDHVNIAKTGTFPGLRPSDTITVRDSEFVGSSRMGWSVTSATNILFENNVLDSARRSLIDLETNTVNDVLTFITIRNNTLGKSRFATLANVGPGGTQHDITFSGNVMQSSGVPVFLKVQVQAPSTARRANYVITNNIAKYPVAANTDALNEPAFTFSHVDGVTVTGNVESFVWWAGWPVRTGTFASPQAPVMTYCSTAVTVADNTFEVAATRPHHIDRPCA